MANELTGDYDVVTAFSLGAVNRILAAMHRGRRLPHAKSFSVDLPILDGIVVAVEELSGLAVTEPRRVKQAVRVRAPGNLSVELMRTVDPIVNPPTATAGVATTTALTLLTSHAGVAQLQLGPPIMKISPSQTDRAEIRAPARIHYRADDQTKPLPPFMRGELVTSFGFKQEASPTGPNIVVDVGGPSGGVHFNSFFSSEILTAEQQQFIDKALTLSLQRSFHSSSAPLPADLRQMHFKGFANKDAVAVMMSVTGTNQPSPNSVSTVFLEGHDQFALAVNGNTITAPFADAVNSAIDHRPPTRDTKVTIDYGLWSDSFHIFTEVRVGLATAQLEAGKLLLTVPVTVRFGWEDKPFFVSDPVDFDFTVSQAFTLTVNGRKVGLQPLEDLVVDIPDFVPDREASPARAQAKTLFDQAWNSQQAAIQEKVNKALSADGLQSFLASMMNPKPSQSPPGGDGSERIEPELKYTRFEIRPSGIILHGTLSVPPWPPPQVEFDKDVWAPAAQPEYRALNSWIPGGTIEEFEWSYSAFTTVKDRERFTTVNASSLSLGINAVCLGFSGARITASGPVAYETVSTPSQCKWTWGPVAEWTTDVSVQAAKRPHIVIPKPGEGSLEVLGHISPWVPDGTKGGAANFVVHFPSDRSVQEFDLLPPALARSGRTSTVVAMLSVPTPGQFSRVRAVDGMLYADDAAGWEKLMGVRERPTTVLLDPKGKEVWRHHGDIGVEQLAQALRQHLVPGGRFHPQFIEPPLRAGGPSPNFVFDSAVAAADTLTLRSLKGRPAALLFLQDSSVPGLKTLRSIRRTFEARFRESGSAIVAIVDGEQGEFTRRLAAGGEGPVVVVADPERQIAKAYSVRLWPTVVFLDPAGLVRGIRVGLISEQELGPKVTSGPIQADEP